MWQLHFWIINDFSAFVNQGQDIKHFCDLRNIVHMSHPIFRDVSPKIVIFYEPMPATTMPQTLSHSSISMHFTQSKSTKCEIFAWNCDFSWNHAYCIDSKPVPLDLACLKPYICTTQAISMHFSQSKSTKCEIFAWNCNFLGTTYHRDSKPVVLDLACL